MSIAAEVCAGCRFYAPDPRRDTGRCRRNAPVPGYAHNAHSMAPAVFPEMGSGEWCGEWEAGRALPVIDGMGDCVQSLGGTPGAWCKYCGTGPCAKHRGVAYA